MQSILILRTVSKLMDNTFICWAYNTNFANTPLARLEDKYISVKGMDLVNHCWIAVRNACVMSWAAGFVTVAPLPAFRLSMCPWNPYFCATVSMFDKICNDRLLQTLYDTSFHTWFKIHVNYVTQFIISVFFIIYCYACFRPCLAVHLVIYFTKDKFCIHRQIIDARVIQFKELVTLYSEPCWLSNATNQKTHFQMNIVVIQFAMLILRHTVMLSNAWLCIACHIVHSIFWPAYNFSFRLYLGYNIHYALQSSSCNFH